MTIKRRLFLSNILMLVMPIILTMLMFTCVIFVVMGVTGMEDIRSLRNENVFYGAVERVDGIADKFTHADLQSIQPEADKLNKEYKEHGITLAVYEDGALIYPSSADMNRVIQMALSGDGDYLIAEGRDAVYKTHTDKFIFILSSTNFSLYTHSPFSDFLYLGAIIFILAIIIVLIVNRALTRFVSKKITTPIDILVSGVHEIRDGNLDYRIRYDYHDEFRFICDDFNEMAQRLSDMVAARQKDEENRKELIAGISHDLRTPLTSIKAYIEGIEKGVASTPQTQKKYIDTIKSKTDDLEHIIGQLFLFSKLDIGEFPLRMERVEVGGALDAFLREAAGEYKDKGLEASLVKKQDGLFADIDIVQFRSVLHNVLENSVKYKAGGTVYSEIICEGNGKDIVIAITDDGLGVPAEDIDKIFDVFYRSDVSRKDPSGGSGLGLAISRKIIERFGGAIRAKNAPSGGLAIFITLPRQGG